MPAVDRYTDILAILDPGDAAVVEEVVKDARAEGRVEGHQQAVARLERWPWLITVGAVVIALTLGAWGGCGVGGGCNTERVYTNTLDLRCRNACMPYAARTTNNGDAYVCECAREDGSVWQRAEGK